MTTGPDTPRGVRIDALPGSATIHLDGAPLDGIVGYQLSHDIRTGLPALVVHTTAPEGAAFEGLARVAVAVDQPPGELVAEFLGEVDAQQLEQAALERGEEPGRYGLTRTMLTVLAEWARTAAPEERGG